MKDRLMNTINLPFRLQGLIFGGSSEGEQDELMTWEMDHDFADD